MILTQSQINPPHQLIILYSAFSTLLTKHTPSQINLSLSLKTTKVQATLPQIKELRLNLLNMDFQLIFEKIGRFNYHNRFIVLFATFTITLIFALGMVNIQMDTDPQSLWVAHDSTGFIQETDFNNRFGAFFRTEQIIMGQNDGKEDNIFKHDYLYSFYFLLNLINQKSVEAQGKNIKIEDLCYRPIKGKGCYRPSPLDLWKMDLADLQNDTQIQYTAMCIQARSEKSRIPCSDENQIPIIRESIYGGITCDDSKDNTSGIIIPCQHCWIQAKTLSATYLLNNDKYTEDSAQIWERDVLIDAIHKFNADNGSFIEEYKKYFPVDDKGWVQVEGGYPLNMNKYMPSKLGVHFEFLSQRSIPDELSNETYQNMWIVVISYLAMFFYIGIAIGEFPSKISSGFTLSIVGIIIVLASVLSSMGLISYMGVGFTMISGEVIPFLILAIGVDNMFLIKNSIERQTQYSKLEDKVAYGLKEVGPNITTAAICEALAFLVGSLTKMPALQHFCVQAAFAILFNYIFQLTTFVVVLIIDEERKADRKLDVFCCIKSQQGPKEPANFWKNKFAGPYFNLLVKKQCFYVVVGISLALLGLAIVGAVYAPVGLNEQVSMEVGSDLYNYFTYEKKYIQIGPPAYVVLNNFDYRNPKHMEYINTMNSQISKLQYIQPPVYTWFASFNNFLQSNQQWSEACGTKNIDQFQYEEQLKKFLDISINSPCCQSYGICGEQYSSDLQFDQNGKLISTRLRVMHKPLRNSHDYIKAARQMRLVVDYAMSPLLAEDSSLQAYPYSLFYVYYDQYSYIRSVAVQNLLLALAVVFLIVTIIKNIKIALTICLMVLVTTLDLIGFVYLLNKIAPDHGFVVETNAISVVNLITCVGLSVEFGAHVCISMFNTESFKSRKQKLQETLRHTGSSVFIGIGLTKFTGVLVLAFAKSTLFRLYYFRMYLGIVLLGLFNGLLVLPVLLYKFGPGVVKSSYSKAKLLDQDKNQ